MSAILVLKICIIFFGLSQITLKKQYFFHFISKNTLGFLIKKHPLLYFFDKRWSSYVHLYLLGSEALHIVFIENIAKLLWILYQISKFYLNLA